MQDKAKGVGSMSGNAGAHRECEVKTLMTPDYPALSRDTTRRLWFVVHAASWLHSMLLHGLVSSGFCLCAS